MLSGSNKCFGGLFANIAVFWGYASLLPMSNVRAALISNSGNETEELRIFYLLHALYLVVANETLFPFLFHSTHCLISKRSLCSVVCISYVLTVKIQIVLQI